MQRSQEALDSFVFEEHTAAQGGKGDGLANQDPATVDAANLGAQQRDGDDLLNKNHREWSSSSSIAAPNRKSSSQPAMQEPPAERVPTKHALMVPLRALRQDTDKQLISSHSSFESPSGERT